MPWLIPVCRLQLQLLVIVLLIVIVFRTLRVAGT